MLGCGLKYTGSTSQELISLRALVLSFDYTLKSPGKLYVPIRHPRLKNQTLWRLEWGRPRCFLNLSRWFHHGNWEPASLGMELSAIPLSFWALCFLSGCRTFCYVSSSTDALTQNKWHMGNSVIDIFKTRGASLVGWEDEMVGEHHQLNGYEFEQIPGDSEGQGNLACCSLWGRKELDTM